MATPEIQALAPALAALLGVPMYLAEHHDLRAALPSQWTWRNAVERVAARAEAATDHERFEVELIEELGDKVVFEAERLAQPLGSNVAVRAFVVRALTQAVAFVRSQQRGSSAWLDELGIPDLEQQLHAELEQDVYAAVTHAPEVVAASDALFSYWREALRELAA